MTTRDESFVPGPGAFRPLVLKAEDADDLRVVSAVLQDAVVKVGDFAWQKRRRRFAAVLNRFVWEEQPSGDPEPFARPERRHFRVRTGLHFDGVLNVSAQGLDPARTDETLELLAVAHEGEADGSGEITLVFAGGGAIRLSVECIDCYLRDLSAPWPTPNLPRHETGTQADGDGAPRGMNPWPSTKV